MAAGPAIPSGETRTYIRSRPKTVTGTVAENSAAKPSAAPANELKPRTILSRPPKRRNSGIEKGFTFIWDSAEVGGRFNPLKKKSVCQCGITDNGDLRVPV